MIQSALLIVLLALVALGLTGPDLVVARIHPMSALLFATAVLGLCLVARARSAPMWKPEHTEDTVADVRDHDAGNEGLAPLLLKFSAAALGVTAAGAAVALTTGAIADRTGLNETLAGSVLTGVATSLPELVTTVAAVRHGALTLAVSDIVGGNFFDVLFIFAADLAYRGGSLYHAPGVGDREAFLTGIAILLNIVLLLGLLYRQRAGPGKIGFESALILAIYLGGMVIVGVSY